MRKEQQFSEMSDIWGLMGLSLTVLHEIEENFSEAFFLGLNERDRRRGTTFSELRKTREKMTFGRMISIMREEWELHPLFDAFISFFAEERNFFIHKLTATKGYNIRLKRDRERLKKRVVFFLNMTLLAEEIFRTAFWASVEMAKILVEEKDGKKIPLEIPDEIKTDISTFLQLCKYKGPFEVGKFNEGMAMYCYLCRWPNGDSSLVFGQDIYDVMNTLDETDDPSDCELIPIRAGALHLKLKNDGTWEYESISEELFDAFDDAYPTVGKALGKLVEEGGKEDSPEWQKKIRGAVSRERKRKLKSHGLDVFEILYGPKDENRKSLRVNKLPCRRG